MKEKVKRTPMPFSSCPSHAARRQQHIMPSGARSVGAAILLPMITSEVAGIEERAALLLPHRTRCSAVAAQELDPVERRADLPARCAAAAAASSSHPPGLAQVAAGCS